MSVLIYGGSFNPPHLGHVDALRSAAEAVRPDHILVVPAGMPPHKAMDSHSPDAEARLRLSELAFGEIPGAQVLDIELKRLGKSYTVDTLQEIADRYEDEQLYFQVGTDMLLSMEKWYQFDQILSACILVALPRDDGDYAQMEKAAQALRQAYAARVVRVKKKPLPMSSTALRDALPLRQGRDKLPDAEYAEIIRYRYYGAKPELAWLREKAYIRLKPSRVAHVAGCEQEAVKLAERWGADVDDAAEAAILHDVTKKLTTEEQLQTCDKYGIILDNFERKEPRILHARTGAYAARDLFGVPEDIFGAIEWHTTGRPGMSELEKIVYLADFTEPNRDFPGVERVRALTFEDLDLAMIEALSMSAEDVRSRGAEPHPRSLEALRWFEEKIHRKDENTC